MKKHIYQLFVVFSLLFSAGLVFNSCSDSDDEMEEMMGKDNPDDMKGDGGTAAPDFSLTALDGSSVSLSDYDNKVLVMFFFGNSCPSCKAAAPGVQSKIADAYASNSNVQVIGLDQWDGNSSSVQGFKNTTNVTFPLLLKASSVASKYNTTYDRLIVVDQQGNIKFKGTQGASKDIDNTLSTISNLLQ